MAKTIKEMAERYGNMPYAIEYGRDKQKGTKLLKQLAFRDGANAVLEEIEKCLEEPSMIQGYSDIMAVVQELKGE